MPNTRAQTDFWSLCQGSYGIMGILENLCMLLPKALEMGAIKDTVALVTDSIGGTKCAPARMLRHLRHLYPAPLNWQAMSTHPKMENGSELCHWKGQLIVGQGYAARAFSSSLKTEHIFLHCQDRNTSSKMQHTAL